MDAASSYAKNEDVFHCLPHQYTDKYGHALNESLAGTSSLAVGHPDRRIALFDSTNLNRNGVSPLTELTKHGRNDQQTVVGFVDGHIKIIRPEPGPFELHPLFDFLVGSGLVISSTMVSISILGMGRAIVARTRGRRTGLVSSE